MRPRPSPRRLFGIAIGAALLVHALPGAAVESPLPALPVVVATAAVSGKPVRDDAWIDAQLAEAERLFGPAGLHLAKTAQRPLDVA